MLLEFYKNTLSILNITSNQQNDTGVKYPLFAEGTTKIQSGVSKLDYIYLIQIVLIFTNSLIP